MALELPPPEPGSHNPRRRVRELSSLLWLCGWGCGTAIALAALAITSQTETASERLRQIFAANESSGIARMPSRITQLESETQILAAQIRTLSTERDRLAGRIALLESTIDDMTGTIKKQAAATAAALAASASASKPISQCAARAPGVRGNKCRRHCHAGGNNCNYAAGERRHTPVAVDPAPTDALGEHDHKRPRGTTCEPE